MGELDRPAFEAAFRGRRVLVTGHTGFKGGWLAVWLHSLGAEVTGLALAPDTDPSFFEDAAVREVCAHHVGDIRELEVVRRLVRDTRPDAIFHLAAQSLVRRSYEQPVDTVATNVLGTAHLLEAVRLERVRAAVVVVSSDKCYENREWPYGYRENDALGGHDLYSASKGAAEIVVQAYRRSFFPPGRLGEHGVALATARAGNVIGGGDWAADRIVPDAVRALTVGRPVPVRNPESVRPWQHVLEPLGGYLRLAAKLMGEGAASYCDAWNFGPRPDNARTVREVVERFLQAWGSGSWTEARAAGSPHEAGLLRLSVDKAIARLDWSPRFTLGETLDCTAEWYRARAGGARGAALRDLCARQIRDYRAARSES